MKKFVVMLLTLALVSALGLTLGCGSALADGVHGEDMVVLSSNPRFPVAGEQAQLTIQIMQDGEPEEGLEVMVLVQKLAGTGGHADDMGEDLAGGEAAAAEMFSLSEASPGAYTGNYTFEQGGVYMLMIHKGSEMIDELELPVRFGPIAWPFIVVLGAVPLLLAGALAVIKSVRKEW